MPRCLGRAIEVLGSALMGYDKEPFAGAPVFTGGRDTFGF